MTEEKVREFKGNGRGPRGPRPKLDHPMQTFLRIMRYLMKYYPVHMVIVVFAIFANVLCNVQGRDVKIGELVYVLQYQGDLLWQFGYQ